MEQIWLDGRVRGGNPNRSVEIEITSGERMHVSVPALPFRFLIWYCEQIGSDGSVRVDIALNVRQEMGLLGGEKAIDLLLVSVVEVRPVGIGSEFGCTLRYFVALRL